MYMYMYIFIFIFISYNLYKYKYIYNIHMYNQEIWQRESERKWKNVNVNGRVDEWYFVDKI